MYFKFALLFACSAIPLIALSPPILELPDSFLPLSSTVQANAAKEWYELALTQINQGSFVEAEHSLIRAAPLPESYTQLGYLYLWQKKENIALLEFKEALKRNPEDKCALAGLQKIATQWAKEKEKEDDALSLCHYLYHCHPTDGDNLFCLGCLLMRKNRLEEAEAAFLETLRLAPQYCDAAAKLGFLYLRENKLEAAEAIVHPFKEKVDAAVVMSTVYLRKNLLKEAAEAVLSFQEQQEAAIALARVYMRTNDLLDAEKILLPFKENEEAAVLLSTVYWRQGRLNEAEALAFPFKDKVDGAVALARIYIKRGRVKEAERLLTPFRKEGDAAILLSAIYLRENRIKEAEEVVSPFQGTADGAVALARVYIREKRFCEAEKRLTPLQNNSDAAVLLSGLFLKKGQLEKAVAIVLPFQHEQEGAVALARVYLRQKKVKVAENLLLSFEGTLEAAVLLSKIYLQQRHFYHAEQLLLPFSNEEEAAIGLSAIYLQQSRLLDAEKILAPFAKKGDVSIALARVYTREDRLFEAEQLLIPLAEEEDAAILLGTVYLRENRLCDAKRVLSPFYQVLEAKKGLAKVAERQGCDSLARSLYQKTLQEDPQDAESHLGLAHVDVSLRKYCQAKREYEWLTKHDPCEEKHWEGLLDVKSHTNPALFLEMNYTKARENDPTLQVPVVADYYLYQALHLLLPLNECWRLDIKQFFYRQKEDDIYPPTAVNYNMHENGGQISSSFFFAKDWRWDVTARCFYANGLGEMTFPFMNTTRFEPGSTLLYKSDKQLFVLEGHVESFVIKNFAEGVSQLLQTDVFELAYGYKPDIYLKPEFELWLRETFFQDDIHNNKFAQMAQVWLHAPYCPENISFLGRFEHGHFKNLTPNYFSYRQQEIYTLGARFHHDFYHQRGYFDAVYTHHWQITHDLIMPIGTFLFIASRQTLVGNKLRACIGYRFFDKLKIELESHYFRDTLPYRDWNVQGSILWQF